VYTQKAIELAVVNGHTELEGKHTLSRNFWIGFWSRHKVKLVAYSLFFFFFVVCVSTVLHLQEVKIKKSIPLSRSRSLAFNRPNITTFHELVRELYETKNIKTAAQVWNVDETSTTDKSLQKSFNVVASSSGSTQPITTVKPIQYALCSLFYATYSFP
jgi:hypothetical protein